jgi:hypothetical protein
VNEREFGEARSFDKKVRIWPLLRYPIVGVFDCASTLNGKEAAIKRYTIKPPRFIDFPPLNEDKL